MAHHSSKDFPEITLEQMQKMYQSEQKPILERIAGLGPTNKFPEGKLNPNDEGELAFAIFVDKGKLIIDFNSPVKWVGLKKEQAIELATILIDRSRELPD